MQYSVFISYRREGGEGFAQMFKDKLSKKRYHVFYDIESIGVGAFDKKILEEINKSDVFLLILSKDALNRCVNGDDWVRQEISYALTLGKPIIPLFFRGFSFPHDLPAEIEKVKLYNGIDIRDMTFLDSKFKQLCKMINDAAKTPRAREPEPEAPKQLPEKATVKAKSVKPIDLPLSKRNAMASKYYKKAMKAGNARFRFIPHKFFNLKKYHYYIKAAELGHPKALKFIFTTNAGTQIVVKRFSLDKATEKHEPFAMFLKGLGKYSEFRCDPSYYLSDMINAFTESAECGYILSQIMLGALYSLSDDLKLNYTCREYIKRSKADYKQALYWYSKAGDQGSAYAYGQIGVLYENGKISVKNMEKAAFYYRRGAEMGDPDAQYRLGKCYMDGEGIDKDLNQAAVWLKLAAEQGHSDAQSALVTLI